MMKRTIIVLEVIKATMDENPYDVQPKLKTTPASEGTYCTLRTFCLLYYLVMVEYSLLVASLLMQGSDSNDNRHLNPSKRKTVFNNNRRPQPPSGDDRSGRLQPSNSVNSLILLQDTGSQEQAVMTE